MSEVKPYILTWSGGIKPTDVDLGTHLTVYGPFLTEDLAISWGEGWQEANGDDPCWQLVLLSKDDMKTDMDGSYLAVSVIAAA